MVGARIRAHAAGAAALLLVALALLPRLTWVAPNEDSGAIGAWAMQAAAGAVPYRDFWAFTTPGSILLYAGLFKLLGASFLNLRLLTALAVLAACAILYGLGRSVLPGAWSAAVTAVWGVWIAVFMQYGPHHHWGVLSALAMAALLLGRRFFLAGVAATLSLFFIQSLLTAVAAAAVAALMLQPSPRRSLLPMAAGALAAGLPVIAYLLASGSLGPALADTVGWSVRYYPASNALPFPWSPAQLHDTVLPEAGAGSLWSVVMFWPLAVFAPLAVAGFAALAVWRRLGGAPATPAGILAVLSTGLFLSAALVRMTGPLLWFVAPLALLLVAVRLRLLARSPAALAPIALVAALGLSPGVYGDLESCQLNPHSWLAPVAAQGGTVCVSRDYAARLAAARSFALEHPGERLAYLPAASSFYLVAGRTPLLPDVYVVPGVTDPAETARLERALLDRRVLWIVYYASDLTTTLPADRALRAAGPTEFDRFLAREYEQVDGGPLPVYRLREAPAG